MHQTFLPLIEPCPSNKDQLDMSEQDFRDLARRNDEAFENMTWLAATHLPIAAAGFVCAVLHGNEDCPQRVELYARNHYKCKPTVAEHDDRANGLAVIQWGEPPKKPGKWWTERLIKGDP